MNATLQDSANFSHSEGAPGPVMGQSHLRDIKWTQDGRTTTKKKMPLKCPWSIMGFFLSSWSSLPLSPPQPSGPGLNASKHDRLSPLRWLAVTIGRL